VNIAEYEHGYRASHQQVLKARLLPSQCSYCGKPPVALDLSQGLRDLISTAAGCSAFPFSPSPRTAVHAGGALCEACVRNQPNTNVSLPRLRELLGTEVEFTPGGENV
jgi:hypothetical protein